MTASHLVKNETKNHLKEQFEIDNINDPRNVIMLCKGIEKAFEAGRIYFVQGDSDRDFLLKVWDPSVVDESMSERKRRSEVWWTGDSLSRETWNHRSSVY